VKVPRRRFFLIFTLVLIHLHILHFTPGEQISGVGLWITNQPSSYLLEKGWWTPFNKGWMLTVMFRGPAEICSGSQSVAPLGYFPNIVSSQQAALSIPLNMSAAEEEGWVRGNCNPEMGIHYALDLVSPGQLTWNASTLMPVFSVYDYGTGSLADIVFFFPQSLDSFAPVGEWEGPINVTTFCDINFCAGCHFPGVSVFSAMHWYFVDYNPLSCPAGSTCNTDE